MKAKLTSLILAAMLLPTASALAKSKRKIPRKPYPVTGVVNINNAPVNKLMLLPYVGRSRANAIVQYRTKQRFRTPNDLVKVKGIGRQTFNRIRAHVTVSGPTTIKRHRPATYSKQRR